MTEWAKGDPALFARLGELAGTELHSLLLEVMRVRAERAPAEVLAQYKRDRFTSPAAVDQRVSVALDAHLLAAAAEFTAIELSPVAPLGTSSSVAPSDQHRVLSALRGTEVVSDPTNVLALECATRPRHRGPARRRRRVRLAREAELEPARGVRRERRRPAAHRTTVCGVAMMKIGSAATVLCSSFPFRGPL